MSDRRRRRAKGQPKGRRGYYALLAVAIIAVLVVGVWFISPRGASQGTSIAGTASTSSSTQSSFSESTKPIILYVNQGNGVVNESNFSSLLSFSVAQGFNTIFFQVYRMGTLLFSTSQLSYFVTQAHQYQGIKIFFTLYITNSSQQIPASIYPLGEDGISLDMSTLPISSQQILLSELEQGYRGTNAITTTDLTLPLSPDLLILETYGTGYDQYIHPGIIASVGVFTTTSKAEYQQEFQYALSNSDGVMVFDYAGLMKSGY